MKLGLSQQEDLLIIIIFLCVYTALLIHIIMVDILIIIFSKIMVKEIIEETLPKAGLTNKYRRLYLLRHSRATHLANHLTEAKMCIIFG